ncbi:hypothetical protein [Stenotrophomonas rhizophila]|uniref:hypothetical protein n=1 Tax=Stenotrophomonas rhizophila TaxID=216778 RepID=UPI0028AA97B6|nr:hypothetical protein [Stenotrophomonas rhizophila]
MKQVLKHDGLDSVGQTQGNAFAAMIAIEPLAPCETPGADRAGERLAASEWGSPATQAAYRQWQANGQAAVKKPREMRLDSTSRERLGV